MKPLNDEEIKRIRKSGKILRSALFEVKDSVKPGISTIKLDKIAERAIRMQGARPSFLNYRSSESKAFPASLCVSINFEIVHGLPSKDKIIKEGDLVSLDLGCSYLGMCTDSALTLIVGEARSIEDIKLIETTRNSLKRGIENAVASNKTGDIGYAIENYVLDNNFSVVKSLVGHGIGRKPHQDPQIPNFGHKNQGDILLERTAIAIEPMVCAGKSDIITKEDGWTVATKDGSNSAHFEHTLLILNKKSEILT